MNINTAFFLLFAVIVSLGAAISSARAMDRLEPVKPAEAQVFMPPMFAMAFGMLNTIKGCGSGTCTATTCPVPEIRQ